MAGRLVALEKSPVIRPVVIGEAIRHLMVKLVNCITAHYAMEACGSNNLCAGLKAGIEGDVNDIKRAFGKKTPPNTFSCNSHPEGATGLKTMWEGGSESTDPPDIDDTESQEELLIQPHWQGDRGNMKTRGSANTNILDPPLTKESALGTQPPSQSAHLPNTSLITAAQDPFLGNKKREKLRPEDDLSR